MFIGVMLWICLFRNYHKRLLIRIFPPHIPPYFVFFGSFFGILIFSLVIFIHVWQNTLDAIWKGSFDKVGCTDRIQLATLSESCKILRSVSCVHIWAQFHNNFILLNLNPKYFQQIIQFSVMFIRNVKRWIYI